MNEAVAVHTKCHGAGSDDDRPPEDWRGEKRSNDTHASKTDPESKLYRNSNAAPALPSYLGHVLNDNRHGLVVNLPSGVNPTMMSGSSSCPRHTRTLPGGQVLHFGFEAAG